MLKLAGSETTMRSDDGRAAAAYFCDHAHAMTQIRGVRRDYPYFQGAMRTAKGLSMLGKKPEGCGGGGGLPLNRFSGLRSARNRAVACGRADECCSGPAELGGATSADWLLTLSVRLEACSVC